MRTEIYGAGLQEVAEQSGITIQTSYTTATYVPAKYKHHCIGFHGTARDLVRFVTVVLPQFYEEYGSQFGGKVISMNWQDVYQTSMDTAGSYGFFWPSIGGDGKPESREW